MLRMIPWPVAALGPWGRRMARPWRNERKSSWRSAPRPWTNSDM